MIEVGHIEKYMALTFSILSLIFTTPTLFFLIKFELNYHNRILINRFLFTILRYFL